MFNTTIKDIFSRVFLIIFLSKMVMLYTPSFIKNFDRNTYLSVVLQLEIENNTSGKGITDTCEEEVFSGYYVRSFDYPDFIIPIYDIESINYFPDDAINIRAFYPSVPTPPPNC